MDPTAKCASRASSERRSESEFVQSNECEAVAHKLEWINPGLWMTAPTTQEELVVGGEFISKEEFVRRENDRLRTFAYQHGAQDSEVEQVFMCRCGFEAKNPSAAWDHARLCRVKRE